jgi:hypothetical protein
MALGLSALRFISNYSIFGRSYFLIRTKRDLKPFLFRPVFLSPSFFGFGVNVFFRIPRGRPRFYRI